MLSLEQSREYNRSKKLQDFLGIHQNAYTAFQPFTDEAAGFNVNFAVLQSLVPGKNAITTGITTDKRELKQKIAAALALACRKTMAYAKRYDKPELAAQTATRDSLIMRMKDSSLPGYVQYMKTLMEPLLTDAGYIPYGVTQPELDALLADAQQFNNMIGVADVTASGYTVANSAINKAIGALRRNIKQFDLLIDEFAESNPAFVEGYHINSAVDNTGSRHSGIEGRVLNKTGEAISGATVQLEGTTKKALANLNGYYRIDRVFTDDYNVVCTAPGYTTQTVMQHISRGKVDELNFVL